MKAVVITFTVLAVVAVSGVIVLQYFFAPTGGVPLEVAKSLLSVLTLAITAQIVSLVIARYNESRQRAIEADRFRLTTIDSLNDAYIGVKRIRRSARAKSDLRSSSGTQEDRLISRRQYFQSLDALNEIQLKLEVLAKGVESNAAIFKGDGQTIFSLVSSMEEYLNQIVDEWEHLNVTFTGKPASVVIQQLPQFQDLIGYYRASQFRDKFVHTYYQALALIRATLLFTGAQNWKGRGSGKPNASQSQRPNGKPAGTAVEAGGSTATPGGHG